MVTLPTALALALVSSGPAPKVVDDPVPPPRELPSVHEVIDEEQLDSARELYDEGVAKYNTADYAGAIEKWTQAFMVLPDKKRYASIRARLTFNIATARIDAFRIDEDIQQLRQAQDLMNRYLESVRGVSDEDEAEAKRWKERIEQMLKEARDKRAAAAAAARSDMPAGTPTPVDAGPDPAKEKRAKALTIAGAATLGVGVALLGAMTGGIVWGRRIESQGEGRADDDGVTAGELQGLLDDGRRANGLAIGAGVAGGVLAVTGAALLAVGLVQRRGAQRAKVGAGPGLSLGASLELRF